MSFNIKISERKIKMAFDRLIENIVKTQNPSVVGLDPKLDYVPEYIKEKKFKKYGKTLKGAAKKAYSTSTLNNTTFKFTDRKSTRLNSSHNNQSRMPSSA